MSVNPNRYPLDKESAIALFEILAKYPGGFNGPQELSERRAIIREYLLQFPQDPNVQRSDSFVTSSLDGHQIPLRSYRTVSGPTSAGVILSIHGGGMVMGSIEEDDGNATRLALETGATVFAVDYRLAPEFPFPTPLEDCFEVACWLLDNSESLGIDIGRSVIYGGSAGGCLAIATAMALRDRRDTNFRAVVAPYPMLDDTNSLPSTNRIIDLGVWDRAANMESWDWYLGAQRDEEVSPYAAPLRATDLTNLPPIFIDVGDCDLFCDEDFIFAQRLTQAGVSVEFHCYPGAFHASELMAPEAELSKRIWRARFNFMSRALSH